MNVQINGEIRNIADGSRIGELLDSFDLPSVRVAVEVNGELVPRREFDEVELRPGDRIEIVTLVGGG